MRMRDNFMGFSKKNFNKKRKKVWLYKVLTHPHPQRNIKTNPPHPHDLLPYGLHLREPQPPFNPKVPTYDQTLFPLLSSTSTSFTKTTMEPSKGFGGKMGLKAQTLLQTSSLRRPPLPPRAQALPWPKTPPKSSYCPLLPPPCTPSLTQEYLAPQPWALKKSKALIGPGIGVGVSIR